MEHSSGNHNSKGEKVSLPEGDEAALIKAAQLVHSSYEDLQDVADPASLLLTTEKLSKADDEEWL